MCDFFLLFFNAAQPHKKSAHYHPLLLPHLAGKLNHVTLINLEAVQANSWFKSSSHRPCLCPRMTLKERILET